MEMCDLLTIDVMMVKLTLQICPLTPPKPLPHISRQQQVSSTFSLFLHKHAPKANMRLDKPAKIRLSWNNWEVICRIWVA